MAAIGQPSSAAQSQKMTYEPVTDSFQAAESPRALSTAPRAAASPPPPPTPDLKEQFPDRPLAPNLQPHAALGAAQVTEAPPDAPDVKLLPKVENVHAEDPRHIDPVKRAGEPPAWAAAAVAAISAAEHEQAAGPGQAPITAKATAPVSVRPAAPILPTPTSGVQSAVPAPIDYSEPFGASPKQPRSEQPGDLAGSDGDILTDIINDNSHPVHYNTDPVRQPSQYSDRQPSVSQEDKAAAKTRSMPADEVDTSSKAEGDGDRADDAALDRALQDADSANKDLAQELAAADAVAAVDKPVEEIVPQKKADQEEAAPAVVAEVIVVEEAEIEVPDDATAEVIEQAAEDLAATEAAADAVEEIVAEAIVHQAAEDIAAQAAEDGTVDPSVIEAVADKAADALVAESEAVEAAQTDLADAIVDQAAEDVGTAADEAGPENSTVPVATVTTITELTADGADDPGATVDVVHSVTMVGSPLQSEDPAAAAAAGIAAVENAVAAASGSHPTEVSPQLLSRGLDAKSPDEVTAASDETAAALADKAKDAVSSTPAAAMLQGEQDSAVAQAALSALRLLLFVLAWLFNSIAMTIKRAKDALVGPETQRQKYS